MGDLVPHESRSVLPDSERDDLAELEAVIERGLPVFFEVGNALMEIRDRRLYRETHKTFDEYCRDRWGFSDSRARQLIAGAKTVTAVTLLGLPAPTTEREARAWAKAIREMQALDPVVNPTLAVHAVRDVLRRDEERQRRRRDHSPGAPMLTHFIGSPMGLPADYQCPWCFYEWSGSARPHDPEEPQGPYATNQQALTAKVHPDAVCACCGTKDDLSLDRANSSRSPEGVRFVCSDSNCHWTLRQRRLHDEDDGDDDGQLA